MPDLTVVIVRIDGEPFLSRAKAYFAELETAYGAWREFAVKVGADTLSDPLGALGFEGDPPKGWIAKTRNGRSRPKRGSPLEAELEALPKNPDSRKIFEGTVLYDLSYETPEGGRGSGGIGFMFFGPSMGRAGEVMIARIPHAGRAAEEHLASHPDHVVLNGAKGWNIPEGLTEISEAEMKFIFAKSRFDGETAAKNAKAA